MTVESLHPYDRLRPEVILDAVDSTGLRTDARMLALNSYENRVYQIGIEDAAPVVVKFYRPGRWTDAQILEEHAFTRQLAEEEVPVVAPLVSADGATLHTHDGFRFAVYPRQGGRAPTRVRSARPGRSLRGRSRLRVRPVFPARSARPGRAGPA